MQVLIRKETASDIDAITEITRAAFKDHPYSQQTEEYIIHALRKANALTLSLVAEAGGQVVGHLAFSPVTISDGTSDWYGLGPISVVLPFQRQGIGSSLIREGLSLLKASGAKGCMLVGDPNYYKRFGFNNIPSLILKGVPPENFVALSFTETVPCGTVTFHEGFSARG